MTCRLVGGIFLMLWYLLSPIRGTSQPPRLSPNHPIRQAFYRHGKTTAQHWLIAMLLSVAIAMGFSYPTVLLSINPTASFAAYPQEGVWTTVKPIDDTNAEVDVEMRQLWIHGSYMSALDKHVLKHALAVQQSLVGDEQLNNVIPELNEPLQSSTLQWGYHSPLMYWNNSADLIDADSDILKTINEQRSTSSSLNVILRPASVFAGKKFAGRQLLAADALIISLMNKAGDDLGDVWQSKMGALTSGPCMNCTLFPQDGNIIRHRVYEFSFTPLSIQEHIALTFAYSFMALYVLLSLRRIKAFHSRFGIVVTAVTQMTCSILASFTICGMLKINLSMIPQNAYPFIVLVLGVENMFRLINAVLAYPPTMATEMRIANALGDIGPISVAAAAQNLTILSLLSIVVSPGVAAFCAFAAIATLFDVFFLLTFFVAVLNVDIRRLELQDALAARHGQPRHRRRPSPAHHTWFDALIQGRLPFSTRMAGTVVTTTFILSLNYHFFEHKESSMNLRHLLDMVRGGPPNAGDPDTFAPPPMNSTLTPSEWVQMQDFDTAKEVMRLAKPGADSFVVRLFAPLVVVLGDADRSNLSKPGDEWAHAVRSFAIHHFYPVAVAIVFIVAFVAVLMNFLLYNEAGDEDNDIALEQLDEVLTTQTVDLPQHRLDVVKMASNDSGHFVTISLDRTIVVSIFDRARQNYTSASVPAHVLQDVAWPIRHLAIDDNGEWVACHCANDAILVWNCMTGAVIPNLVQYPDDHPAVQFTFLALPSQGSMKLHFLVLSSGGRLAMSCLEDGKSMGQDLSILSLVGAAICDTAAHGRQLVTINEGGAIISYVWIDGKWEASKTQTVQLQTPSDGMNSSVKLQLYADLDTELLVVTMSNCCVFLSAVTLALVATFNLGRLEGHVEDVLIGPSRRCQACGGLALRRFAVSSRSGSSSSITTWSVDDDDVCICLAGGSTDCKSFDNAVKDHHTISNAGAWSPLRSQAVLGLRKRAQNTEQTSVDIRRPTTTQLRQRRHARQSGKSNDDGDQWEAYKFTVMGDMEIVDAGHDAEPGFGQDTNLYVSNAGPVVPLDSQAVAVAFGNTVRVIRTSRRGSINRSSVATSLERQSSTTRRVTSRRAR